VFASSVSVLEIQIKSMLGKMKVDVDLIEAIKTAGLKELDFKIVHANELSAFLKLAKHDPFDRMLLAQAQTESMKLMTSDKFLLNLGLSFVLDAKE
jgi:PIN domain nuclease of toxin-antitoxin system